MDEVGKMMLDDDIMDCTEIWNKYSNFCLQEWKISEKTATAMTA